jgi:cobalt-zinc-cadmium efflux system membrane fusion protein
MYRSWKILPHLGFALVLFTNCQNASPPTENAHSAEHSVSITQWTDKTELFVEFPSLVVGKEAPLAVHLTDLSTFQPVSSETLTTSLEGQDGHTVTLRTETPTVPGIYRPVLKPDAPGKYRLVFHRISSGDQKVYDTIEAGTVEVATTEEDIPHQDEESQGAGITFLKEQQWQMEFATAPVTEKELQPTLKLHAEVKPRAGGEVHIIAPVAGRGLMGEKGVPAPGQRVEPGELLAMVLPLHQSTTNRTELESAAKTTQAELEAAQQELGRVQDLYKDRIVPKRRVEQAQKETAVLQARLASARSQLSLLDMSQTLNEKMVSPALERFILRSPLAGTVVATRMTPGALLEAGQELFTIVDLERVWIEGRLFESDLAKVQHVEQARFEAPALPTPLVLSPSNARLVTIGSVIDPATRSVPLLIETQNPQGQLKIEMHGELFVPIGKSIQTLAIPTSAVVDDKGIAVAFVQRAGETFERQELELGVQSEGYVQVKAGLIAGERIVTEGAYRVHLASLSSELPAHGHAH